MGLSKELSIQEKELTVNMTFKIQGKDLVPFENEMRDNFDVIDYMVVPNTDELYENDATYRKLVKQAKKAKEDKYNYINEKNK